MTEELNWGPPRNNSSLVVRAGLEPATSGFQVRRPNHSATLPPQTNVCMCINFPFSNTGGSGSFRLHEILQTAYLLGALEVMADSVIISQKMSIYLDLLASLKEKVSINHLFFAFCFMHCKTIFWSCRLIPSLISGYFRSLLHICLKILSLKLNSKTHDRYRGGTKIQSSRMNQCIASILALYYMYYFASFLCKPISFRITCFA